MAKKKSAGKAAGKATGKIAKEATKKIKVPKPKAELHQIGRYGELKSKYTAGSLQMDHIPSRAAQVRIAEEKLGRKLTPSEAEKIRRHGGAIAIEGSDHQTYSRTTGGKNTPQQIADDGADPVGAITRDLDTYVDTGVMTREQADQFRGDLEALLDYDNLTKEYYVELLGDVN